MGTKFTLRQRGQVEKLAGDVLASFGPDKDELHERVLAASRSVLFQARLREVFVAFLAQYFMPLMDEEALVWLVEQAGKSEADAMQLIAGCRKGAMEQGLDSDPCHYAVEAGATIKVTIPALGPCVEDFRYLQRWTFPDNPTEQCLVSGVSSALCETTNQDLATQLRTLAAIEARWGIPAGFFSRELMPTVYMAGVALAHHEVTRQNMFNGLRVRTGACFPDRGWLNLRWRGGRLYCDYWFWDEDEHPDFAVSALGVTKAFGR